MDENIRKIRLTGHDSELNSTDTLVAAMEIVRDMGNLRLIVLGFKQDGDDYVAIDNCRSIAERVGLLKMASDTAWNINEDDGDEN
jgi:hypothetical protein